MATNARATKSASTFRMECRVSTDIRSTPDKIWRLLTRPPPDALDLEPVGTRLIGVPEQS